MRSRSGPSRRLLDRTVCPGAVGSFVVTGWYASWVDRDVVEVRGQGAANFLQSQLYRDVLALRDGDSAWAWVLSREGTVDSFVRATRVTETYWVIDTDRGWGEALQARLEAPFKTRTVQFARPSWKALRLVFQGMANMRADPEVVKAWVHWWRWPFLGTIDLLGPQPEVPADYPIVSSEDYEAVRIASWFPRMGAEITPTTRPVETGFTEWSVWYEPDRDQAARQWLERVPPDRRLAGFRLAGPVETSTALVDAHGNSVGVVTSAAFDRHRGWVGLGYLDSEVRADVVWAGQGGQTALIRREPG